MNWAEQMWEDALKTAIAIHTAREAVKPKCKKSVRIPVPPQPKRPWVDDPEPETSCQCARLGRMAPCSWCTREVDQS